MAKKSVNSAALRSNRAALLTAKGLVSVTSFSDYREFLRALYEETKRQLARYSYEVFAQDLGLSASNVVRLVVTGKRLLTPYVAKRIIEALEIKHAERVYFLELILYQNSKNPDTKGDGVAKLIKLKQQAVDSEIERSKLAYFAQWYHPIIRELSRLPDFVADPHWIVGKLHTKVSAERVRESLELLEHLGLLKRTDVALTANEQAPMILMAERTASRLAALAFHEQMLGVSRSALGVVPDGDYEVNALTVAISSEDFAKVKQKIEELCEYILALDNRSQGRDCVAQLNVQFFKVTTP